VGPFLAFPWLVLVAGVGNYALAEVEMGVVFCIFLYFCGCQGVGGCVLAYAHTWGLLQGI